MELPGEVGELSCLSSRSPAAWPAGCRLDLSSLSVGQSSMPLFPPPGFVHADRPTAPRAGRRRSLGRGHW